MRNVEINEVMIWAARAAVLAVTLSLVGMYRSELRIEEQQARLAHEVASLRAQLAGEHLTAHRSESIVGREN